MSWFDDIPDEHAKRARDDWDAYIELPSITTMGQFYYLVGRGDNARLRLVGRRRYEEIMETFAEFLDQRPHLTAKQLWMVSEKRREAELEYQSRRDNDQPIRGLLRKLIK